MASTVACPFCGKGFSDAWELFLNDLGDDEERSVGCEACGNEFVIQRVVEVEYRAKEVRKS